MSSRRIERINSLLKEVISDVIRKEVKNPRLPQLITVTNVDVTKDLRHAKVFVSVIGEEAVKNEAIDVLQSAAGFIGIHASKQVVMRYFPELTFVLDDSVEKQMHIDRLISDIQAEREIREHE
ncbi:MAG: 30S ribosome-binding factor RbfA [Chlamydiales bacterium]|nr:30S ribosome-binding factor RbfA [Chlamydiales bacterium]